jgi:ribosome recycling factor
VKALQESSENAMKAAIDSLTRELTKVRTGKANVSMLDSIKVDYYGSLSPLNQVAGVSTPDPKSFLIAPWEPSTLKAIETAILKSDIGMTPINDGKTIRLKLPELTEERRKELVKLTKKIVEEGRVAVRMARREANEKIKKMLKDKEITEDENKSGQADIQKLTDKYIEAVDKIAEDKEKEIMTI